MTLDEMRDKIAGPHSDLLKQMLKLNELPEPLLKRYFVIKKVLDKVSGHISAEGLLRIAMDVGLNPETVLFEGLLHEVALGSIEGAKIHNKAISPGEIAKLAETAAESGIVLPEKTEDEKADTMTQSATVQPTDSEDTTEEADEVPDGEEIKVEGITEEISKEVADAVAEEETSGPESINGTVREDLKTVPAESGGTFEAAKRRGQEENAEAISKEIEADAAEEVEKKKEALELSSGYEIGENGDLVALEEEGAEFKNGTTVKVFAGGQIKKGEVKCSFMEDGVMVYKVETEDVIWEIDEENVQLPED